MDLESDNGAEYKKPRKNSAIIAFFVIIIILTAFFIITAIRNKEKEAEESRKEMFRVHIRDYVKISKNVFKVNPLGGIKDLEITVNNTSPYEIDRLWVDVFYYKTNGEVYKKERLEFTNIPPSSKATLKAPDSDRGTSVELKSGELNSDELSL